MDTVIADWLAQSPQPANDGGQELACVDPWLNQGLTDLGAELAEDEIARSLEEFTGQEFFNDSPPPYADRESDNAPMQQLSASSQPTSSGEGPTSSGAVCGGSLGNGMGQLSRGFRSFSTNDLQLLLEQPTSLLPLLPPVTGLSAPPHGFTSHMSLVGPKVKTRPALESVPECGPSPGAPVVAPPSPMAVLAGAMVAGAGGSSDPAVGAYSPALQASPGTTPVHFMSRSAPETGLFAPAVTAYGLPPASGGAVTPVPSVDEAAVPAPPSPPPQQQPPVPVLEPPRVLGGGGALRHVPSTGTLSTLMNNTLTFQREGTDESSQQQAQSSAAPPASSFLQPTQDQQAKPETPSATHAPAAQVSTMNAAPPPGGAAVADYASSAAAAAAAAVAAAGVYPLAVVPSAGTVSALPHYALPPHPGLYGMAPHLYSAASIPSSAYPLGVALPLPPSVLSGHVMGAAEDGAGAAGSAATAAATAGADSAAAAPAFGGPRLRKSQSALELGAWRTASVELAPEIAEASASAVTGQKLIGRLTPEERLQRILRYRNKRNQRNFNREIKYMCRKTLADSRPRVGGRFARNNDPNSVLPHQTKKAMRMKGGPGSGGWARGAPENAACTAATGSGMMSPERLSEAQAPTVPPQQRQEHPAMTRQPSQPGPVQPSSSSTTTGSVSSDTQGAACASSGAAVLPVASGGAATSYAAAKPPTPFSSSGGGAAADVSQTAQPTAFAAAACLPFPYTLPGLSYAAHGLTPGRVGAQTHAAGLQQTLAVAPPPAVLTAGINAAHLHHHYAVVNAAAQAAAQGVYAHLGVASASAPMQALHGTLQAPALMNGCAFVATGGAPPCPANTAIGAVTSTAVAATTSAPRAVAAIVKTEAPAAVEVPPRVDTPLIDALWSQFGEDMEDQAAAGGGAPEAEVVGPSATCMAVDG